MATNRNWLAGTSANLVSSLTQVYDPTGIGYNVNDGTAYATGIWRNLMPSDFGGGGGVGSNVAVTNAVLAVSGVVQSASASSSTVSNSSISGISNGGFGVILPNNASRKQLFVQNLSTGRLLVRFSATLPTTGSYNVVLKGGTAMADGLGAAYESYSYSGPVSVTGWDASTPIQYISWEL